MNNKKFSVQPDRPIYQELPVCEIIGDELIKIPSTDYEAMYESYTLRDYMGSGKVDMKFRLIEGDHFGKELLRHFNVVLHKDWKTGGGFNVQARSDYLREMKHLLPEGDLWANPENLLGKSIIVKVELVKHDRRRTQLDDSSQYSVIRQLVRLKNE